MNFRKTLSLLPRIPLIRTQLPRILFPRLLLSLGLLLGPLWVLASSPGPATAAAAPAPAGDTAPPRAPAPPEDPQPTPGDPDSPPRPVPVDPDSGDPAPAPSDPADPDSGQPSAPGTPPKTNPDQGRIPAPPPGAEEDPAGAADPGRAPGPSAYPGLRATRHESGLALRRRRAPPPPPRDWRLRLVARSFSLLVRSSSLDALQSEDLVQSGEISLGGELRLWRDLVLGVELGYGGGRSTDSLFESFRTRLRHDVALLGVSLGWRLWDAFMPYVRGGVAVTWLQGWVRTDETSLGGRDLAAGGYLVAGLELGFPRAWFRTSSLSMAFHLEAGWAHLGRFNLEGGLNESNLVDEHRAGLGRLTLSGAAVNVGLSLSF